MSDLQELNSETKEFFLKRIEQLSLELLEKDNTIEHLLSVVDEQTNNCEKLDAHCSEKQSIIDFLVSLSAVNGCDCCNELITEDIRTRIANSNMDPHFYEAQASSIRKRHEAAMEKLRAEFDNEREQYLRTIEEITQWNESIVFFLNLEMDDMAKQLRETGQRLRALEELSQSKNKAFARKTEDCNGEEVDTHFTDLDLEDSSCSSSASEYCMTPIEYYWDCVEQREPTEIAIPFSKLEQPPEETEKNCSIRETFLQNSNDSVDDR